MRGEKCINRRISGLHNLWRERVCNLLRRKLSAGVVDGAGRGEDELGDGEDGVAVVDEAGEDSGQRLRWWRAALWNSTMLPAVPWRSPAGRWCPRHNPSSRGSPIGKDLKPLRRKGFHNMTSSIKITRRMQGLNLQAIKKSGAGTDGIVFQKLPRKLPHRTHNESSESTCGAAPKRKPSCRGATR